MNLRTVKKAITEAKRFIDAAEMVVADRTERDVYIGPSKYSGACRRASMELSRALSEMTEAGMTRRGPSDERDHRDHHRTRWIAYRGRA